MVETKRKEVEDLVLLGEKLMEGIFLMLIWEIYLMERKKENFQ